MIALRPIGTLIPNWVPWQVFWIGFFGVAFIVVGLSTSFNFLQTPGVIGLGLIFAIWVLTVHLS